MFMAGGGAGLPARGGGQGAGYTRRQPLQLQQPLAGTRMEPPLRQWQRRLEAVRCWRRLPAWRRNLQRPSMSVCSGVGEIERGESRGDERTSSCQARGAKNTLERHQTVGVERT